MTIEELIELINDNNINPDTTITITLLEDNQPIIRLARLEFFENGEPAIKEGIIGIRIQRITGAAFAPQAGGITFESIINIEVANE